MALLTRRTAVVAAAMLVASCNGDSEVGTIEVDIYEGEVDCALGFECRDAYGEEAPHENLSGFAFLTTETSEHYPDGLFVYFEIARPDGILARGEMDLPLSGEGEPRITYTETNGSEVVFVAEEIVGLVEVPEEALGEECTCLDGRLELILRDAEGQTRRLSRSRFGWSDRACVERARFTDLGEELTIVPRTCGADRVYVPPSTEVPAPDYDGPPRYTYDDDGCDSSSCSGATVGSGSCGGGSASGGCDGGGGGCDGGGGGCEGDVGGGSGCSGDVGGGGGCAGDTGGCRVVGRPRHVGPRGPLQTALLIAGALAWVIRPRRWR